MGKLKTNPLDLSGNRSRRRAPGFKIGDRAEHWDAVINEYLGHYRPSRHNSKSTSARHHYKLLCDCLQGYFEMDQNELKTVTYVACPTCRKAKAKKASALAHAAKAEKRKITEAVKSITPSNCWPALGRLEDHGGRHD